MHTQQKNKLGGFFTKSEQALDRRLSRPATKINKKEIHKVRVSIKKMKAVYQLMEFIFPVYFDYGKHYHKLKKVFRSMGGQRELQLNNRYIKDYDLSDVSRKIYTQFYSVQKDKTEQKFRKALQEYDKDSVAQSVKKVYKLIEKLSDAEISVMVERFILEEGFEIHQLLKKYGEPAKIHEIRKHLKNLIYIIPFFKPGKETGFIIAHLKESEKLIGDWHDKITLVAFINKLIKKNARIKHVAARPFYKMIEILSHENEIIVSQLKPKLENIIVTLELI